jgi:hypothetical protein
MKLLKYTRHAKNGMRWRRITESEIESAVNNPDFTGSSLEGKIHAWRKLSDKYLRVTFKNELDRILIITA